MESFLLIIVLLTLVTIVYVSAYKIGYKAAQAKAASVMQEFSEPVTELMDKLHQSVERCTPHQDL
jgi:hypothetical protein